MKIKDLAPVLSVIATFCLLQACVIEENYHFTKDMSGHYEMMFDLGKFADKDSTGEMMKGVVDGMMEEVSKMENLEGLTSLTSKVEDTKAYVSYDFSGIDLLNTIENLDDEGKKKDYFNYSKGVLTLNPNMDSMKKGAKKDKSDEEMAQLLSTMLEYKITVTFDKEMDVKKMEGFEQLDAKTFVFNSATAGWDKSPILKLKDK